MKTLGQPEALYRSWDGSRRREAQAWRKGMDSAEVARHYHGIAERFADLLWRICWR